MWVLSRKPGQKIVVEGPCVIEIIKLRESHVGVGIMTQSGVKIWRGEKAPGSVVDSIAPITSKESEV